MDSTTLGAAVDETDIGHTAQVGFAMLDAVITDGAHSAARWSLAGHDQVEVFRHRKREYGFPVSETSIVGWRTGQFLLTTGWFGPADLSILSVVLGEQGRITIDVIKKCHRLFQVCGRCNARL
jgi:hypothetical protein